MNEWRPPLWPHNCQLPERPSTMLIIIIFQGTVTEAGDVLIPSTSPEVNLQHTYHSTSPVSVASRESPTLDGPTTDEDADDERYQGTIAIVCLLQEYLPGWLVGCKVTKRWGKRWWLAKNISTICLHFCPRAHYSQFKMTPHNWKYSRHISRGAWLQYSYIPPRPHTPASSSTFACCRLWIVPRSDKGPLKRTNDQPHCKAHTVQSSATKVPAKTVLLTSYNHMARLSFLNLACVVARRRGCHRHVIWSPIIIL